MKTRKTNSHRFTIKYADVLDEFIITGNQAKAIEGAMKRFDALDSFYGLKELYYNETLIYDNSKPFDL